MRLPAGKLPPGLLRRLLASLPAPDPSVVVWGQVGEDAAVIDLGLPELLVAKTDPITLAGEESGAYLLAVNANDLATAGAEPRWLLVTALLPEGIEEQRVAELFDGLAGACREYGVSLVGGHTEMTAGLDRPILVGCLLGTVLREGMIRTADARVGDALLLAGGIAIEGTAILAREHAGALRERGVEEAVIARAAGWLRRPGIGVLPAARILRAGGGVHAMHDATEGGIVTALHEMGEAASAGIDVELEAIPILPECRAICAALELDPLGLLASGALLAAVDAGTAEEHLRRLGEAGIPAVRIGEIVETSRQRALPVFGRDELARYLERANGGVRAYRPGGST